MQRKLLTHCLSFLFLCSVTPYSFAGDVSVDNFTVADLTDDVSLSLQDLDGDTVPETFDIIETLGRREGDNLFHSFYSFNIESGEIALFSGDPGIQHVVSRVTGGSASLINGTVSNAIAGSGFWFVNTAGVVIGENAVFDVSGALAIGAVDYVEFANGERFYGVPSPGEDISLLNVNPVDFGFLDPTSAGTLTISGLSLDDTGAGAGLEVGDITLAGGDVALNDVSIVNDPESSGGSIQLLAAGSLLLDNVSVSANTASALDGGDVTLSGTDITLLDGTQIATVSTGDGDAGDVAIIASGQLDSNVDGGTGAPLDGVAEVGINSDSLSDAATGGAVGSISVQAAEMLLAATGISSSLATNDAGSIPGVVELLSSGNMTLHDVRVASTTTGAANGADVMLTALDIRLENGAALTSVATGPGDTSADPLPPDAVDPVGIPNLASIGLAGDISVVASGDVMANIDPGTGLPDSLWNLVTISSAGANDDARGPGSISVRSDTGNVQLANTLVSSTTNSALAPADGAFEGGIMVDAGGHILLDGVTLTTVTEGAADSGDIAMTAVGDISLADGTTVNASNGFSAIGGAGNIDLTAGGRVLGNVDPVSLLPIGGSQVSLSVRLNGTGVDAGGLSISGSDVLLSNTNVSVNNFSANPANTTGSVTVDALGGGAASGILELANVSINGDSSGAGSAPTIQLSSVDAMRISNSIILDATFGSGPGGVIDIQAGTDMIVSDLTVLNESFSVGNAGSLTLGAGGDLSLADSNLQTPGINAGEAGSISVSAGGEVVMEASILSAPGQSSGDAGSISIAGDALTMTATSLSTSTNSDAAPLSASAGDISLNVANAAVLTDSSLQASTTGDAQAGDITVQSGAFVMDGGFITAQNTSKDGGVGAAGNITFSGGINPLGAFTILNGGDVLADAGDNGVSAGDVLINATGLVSIAGTDTDVAMIESSAATGTVGSISITGGSLHMTDAAITSEVGGVSAAAGTPVTLTANDALGTGIVLADTEVSADTTGTPDAGNITLVGPSISISGGSLQSASSGDGDAGRIFLNWPGSQGAVSLTTTTITTNASGGGRAGDIIVGGDTISVIDSSIEAAASGNSGGLVALVGENGITMTGSSMSASSAAASLDSGSLVGGSIYLWNGFFSPGTGDIQVQNSDIAIDLSGAASGGAVFLRNGGLVSLTDTDVSLTTSGAGDAGAIFVQAGGLDMSGGTLTSATLGTGNAGNISISGFTNPLGDVNITDGGDISVNAGVFPFVGGSYGAAGNISIDATGTVTLAGVDANNRVEITSSSFDGADQAGTIRIDADLLDSSFALLSTETRSADATDTRATITLFIDSLASLNNTLIQASTFGAADAGNISINANDIYLADGSSLSAPSTLFATGGAGNVSVVAVEDLLVNVDPLTLAGTGGSQVRIDTRLDGNAATAGDLTLSGGDVRLSNVRIASNNNSTALTPSVGSVSIIATGAGDALGVLDIEFMALNGDSSQNGPAPTILLSSADALRIANSSILDASFGQGQGGLIDIVAGTDLTTSGVTILAEGFDSGDAGTVNFAAGGGITLTGTTVFAPAYDAGAAGTITFTAQSLDLTNSTFSTTTSSDNTSFPDDAGDITANIQGPINMSFASLEASTSGDAKAGDITLNSTSFFMQGGQIAAQNVGGVEDTGAAGSITFNDGLDPDLVLDTFTITDGGDVLADAGIAGSAASPINITATGDVSISGTSTNQAEIKSSATSGAAAPVTISGASVTLSEALISTEAGGEGGGPLPDLPPGATLTGADITIEAVDADGSGVNLTNTAVVASSSGIPQAGAVLISGPVFNMSGGSLESTSSGSGNGGDIFVNWPDLLLFPGSVGTATINGATISASATDTGRAGNIIIAGDSISIADTAIEADAAANGAGLVALVSDAGMVLNASSLTASSSGAEDGTGGFTGGSVYLLDGFLGGVTGDITMTDSVLTVDLSGGASDGLLIVQTPGEVFSTNSQVSSITRGSGDAGDVILRASALSMSGGVLQSSTLGAGNAGSIDIRGLSTAAIGDVSLTDGADILAIAGMEPAGGGIFGNAGSISIVSDGLITLSGVDASNPVEISSSSFAGANQAGTISISGGALNTDFVALSTATASTAVYPPAAIDLQFAGGSVVMNNSSVVASTSGASDAGNISINADTIEIIGPLQATGGATPVQLGIESSSTATEVDPALAGAAGQISFTANSLLLDTNVSTSTASDDETNQLGTISADINGPITIAGGQIEASTSGRSDAGNISFTGDSVVMDSGPVIQATSSAEGAAGSISIVGINGVSSTTGGVQINSSASALASDGAGSIVITAGEVDSEGEVITAADVSLTNAMITSSTGSDIDPLVAGSVTIEATGNIVINGGAYATESIAGQADSGDIVIGGVNGAAANSISLSDSAFTANSLAGGEAGSIEFRAMESITGRSGLTIASSGIGGTGGSISFEAADIDLQTTPGEGLINASAQQANGGSILFMAGDSITIAGVDIQATASGTDSITNEGEAGSITFTGTGGSATGVLHVSNSSIVSSANGFPDETGDSGSAGDVLMEAASVIMADTTIDSRQLSQSTGGGASGTITIDAERVEMTNTDLSTATASNNLGFAPGGLISVTASNTGEPGSGTVSLIGSNLTSTTTGDMNAGDLYISAENVSISGGVLASSTAAVSDNAGAGGNIFINYLTDYELFGIGFVPGTLRISGGARVLAESTGSGRAGFIIAASDTVFVENATLSAASAGGGAGFVALLGESGIDISDNAVINASSAGSGAAGGGISSNGALYIWNGFFTPGSGDINITDSILSVDLSGDASAFNSFIVLETPGSINLINSTLSATSSSTNENGHAGDIYANGSAFAISGGLMQSSTTGAGDAGNIQIAGPGAFLDSSAASTGEVSITDGAIIRATAGIEGENTGSFGSAGSIDILSNAGISLAGLDADRRTEISSSSFAGAGDAGTITLTGAELTASFVELSTETASAVAGSAATIDLGIDGPVTLQETLIEASTSGATAAGAVSIRGSAIGLSDNTTLTVSTTGSGDAGNVSLEAEGAIDMGSDTRIAATSANSGNAGSVTLVAGGVVNITGATVESSSLGEGVGLAGSVTVRGGDLQLNNALISTRTDSDIPEESVPEGLEEPGKIFLVSDTGVRLDQTTVETVATGGADAGDINIEALSGDIDLVNESTVTAATSGGGDAGDVSLIASGNINLPLNTEVSAKSTGPGDAGSVSVQAGGALLIDHAVVTSSSDGEGVGTAGNVSLSGSEITLISGLVSTRSSSDKTAPDDADGSGAPGDPQSAEEEDVQPGTITINSPGLVLLDLDSTISASVSGAASGGEIRIAANDLHLQEGSVIETRATGAGDSGSVTLNVLNDLVLLTPKEAEIPDEQSAILTNSFASRGGSITANIGGVLFMDRSRIESSVETADGQGGDITLTTNGLFMVGSQILARADQGNGGAIFISRGERTPDPATDTPFDGLFIIDAESLINADSQAGVNGEINVDSPDADLSSVVEVVEARIVEDPTLADDVCDPSSVEAQSSFIVEDQGGVTPSPDGYFSAGVLDGETQGALNAEPQRDASEPLLAAVAGGCR